MPIITHQSISGSLEDSNKPRIGYHNLFREGTVTVSSAHSDYPKELAYDGFTYDWWRGLGGSPSEEWIAVNVPGSPTEAADYMGVAAHTLSGATLTPQRSANGSTWTDLENSFVPTSNRPIVWEWSSVASPYWRLLIQNPVATVQIGAIHVGRKLTMQRGLNVGWRPPSMNEDRKYTATGSEGGQSLGRSLIRRGVTLEIDTMHADVTWARGDWADMIEVAERWAVFFWWANEGLGDVVYGQMTASSASFSTEHLVSTRLTISGIVR